MRRRKLEHCFLFCAFFLVTSVTSAFAQRIEATGSRALGMGGAFVAVASDASATWWNPAGPAEGPFLDASVSQAITETRDSIPAHRDTVTSFALMTPPFGFSYYRFQIIEIDTPAGGVSSPTVTESGNRKIGVLAASQLGATLVQTLIPGFHAGVTLKYLRGRVRTALENGALSTAALLDRGAELDGGEVDTAFGADIGLIAVGGPLRAGLLVRNAVEAEFRHGTDAAGETAVRLDRQFRVGVAYDGVMARRSPLVVAVDADVSEIATVTGDRRNVAFGAERWFLSQRLAVRGGARFNTVGAKERAVTAGASASVRAGLFVDAHVVGGGNEDDRGWGVAARVSF